MEQHTVYGDIQHDNAHGGGTKEIWQVTIILSVLTIVELALGFWMMGMEENLKHEVRNLIMTIVVPCGLFIWFIIAFLFDGNSFNNLRNTYNPVYKQRTTEKAPATEENNTEKKEVKKPGQE
jgi:hypothetical protein